MANPSLASKAKALFSGPPDKGIGEAQRNIDEYTAATKPAPAKPAPSGSASSTPINPKAKYGDRSGEKRIDTTNMTKPLGSFKKGGRVKKTGLYKLHKGEKVMNAKQTKKMDRKGMGALFGK